MTAADATTTIAREAARQGRPPIAIRRVGRVALTAAGIGLIGQLLFFDVGLGLNVPLATVLLLGAGRSVRIPGRRIAWTDAWIAPAALVFAAFVALRADPTLVILDLVATLVLSGAAAASLSGRPVTRLALRPLLRLAGITGSWVMGGALHVVGGAARLLPARGVGPHRLRPALPVLRGLLIALPIVAVFVALFASADAVFADLVGDLVAVQLDPEQAIGRAMAACAFGWLAAGFLAFVAAEEREKADADPRAERRVRLGTTETITLLAAVGSVFLAFVVLQAAYLFGGLDTLAATGLTYAEYARRGFFELVAVAVLAGGLLVALDHLVRSRSRAYVVLAVGLTGLTAVVLASGALRMRLYQEAYGWTELRLYVVAAIGVLAIALVALAVALLVDRVRWMPHAIIAAGLVAGLVLNLVGPVRYVTEQNVARALDPALVPAHGSTGLDRAYLGRLGLDAVPALVAALPAMDAGERSWLRTHLRWVLWELRREGMLDDWQAWNAGRTAARSALERAEAAGLLTRP